MKTPSIFVLATTFFVARHIAAADYAAAVRADKPALYWRFEAVSGDVVRDESGNTDGRAKATGPGRRGISGLAASFERSHLAGRIESELAPEQDAAVEEILNGSFTLELWLLDEAAKPDNVVNSSLFYKADESQFSRNSMWIYRARQDGHYYFRIHDFRIHDTGEKTIGVSIRNPAGDQAAGDGMWHHVAIIVDRSQSEGTMRALLDGKQVNESTFPSMTKIDNDGPLRIGNGVHPNSPWQGSIDEFALYDRYGLYGIFESTTYPWMGMSNEKSPSDLSPAVPRPNAFKQAEEYWSLITRCEYQINNHHRPWLKPTLDEFKIVSQQIEKAQQAEADLTEVEARREKLLAFRGGAFRELMLHGLAWIKQEKQRLANEPPVEFVFAVSEGEPHDAKLHRRGNPRQPGAIVARRFLQVLGGQTPPSIESGSGRLELARWLTQPDHPLTARVLVNRVWQQHFGRGLVATPDNFGRQGVKPSHPQLLDWLSETFVRDGWSLKKLHRRIMLTESYQLSSSAPANTTSIDPENIFVARYPRRRLDAESIRDAMLAVSGQLDRTQGGAHPMQPWYDNRFSLNNPFQMEPASTRRSVYLLTQRLFRHSILDQFDGPDRNSSTSSRRTSNVPAQALFLMNSTFIREQSEALAARLATIDDVDARIAGLFLSAFGRAPEAEEVTSLKEFLSEYRAAQPGTAGPGPPRALMALSRAILTSNEFFFVD